MSDRLDGIRNGKVRGVIQSSAPLLFSSTPSLPASLPTHLREDVQELGNQLAAPTRVLRDDVGVVKDAAFLQHRRLFQVLVGRDCVRRMGWEGGRGNYEYFFALPLLLCLASLSDRRGGGCGACVAC